MKRHVKVRVKQISQISQMVINAKKDLRTEILILIRLVFREIGAILREIVIGLWEGLNGPQKPIRRHRAVRQTPSW